MTSYRVSPELILDIADYCDRATLKVLMQTSKDINILISKHQRSISAAKLKRYLLPPLGEVLSSKDERRCRITGKYSFATIQELDLREQRMRSVLDNSCFLLTDSASTLRLTDESLMRFKAGLKRALYITDRLADLETRPEVQSVQNGIAKRLSSLQVGCEGVSGAADENEVDKMEALDEVVMLQHDVEVEAQNLAVMTQRSLQFKMICDLTTLDLAWLLTLCEGAMRSCARYLEKMFLSDPAGTDYKVMAFKEELLRRGSFIMWAFVRGVGSINAFARRALKQTGDEIMGFEFGQHSNSGLSSAVHKEMRQRVLETLQRENPCSSWDEETLSPASVMAKVHDMIGKEIGCKAWNGYGSFVHPPME